MVASILRIQNKSREVPAICVLQHHVEDPLFRKISCQRRVSPQKKPDPISYLWLAPKRAIALDDIRVVERLKQVHLRGHARVSTNGI
jgi:hypothetical protein